MKRSDIPIGRNNAISRKALAALWGCSDREARHEIARMRRDSSDGYAILSSSRSPRGYWRSNNSAEISEFIRETESRARNTFGALRGARDILKKTA